MFGYRGANTRLEPALLDEEYIARADVFHLSGYALLAEPQRSAARQAVELAHRAGVTISLDTGLEAAAKVTEEVKTLLPLVGLFFPNRAEAEHLTDGNDIREAVRALLGYGIETVALKLGEEGCIIGSEGEVFSVPTCAVEVQDTTGAGDSFDAGFVLGRLWGLGVRESAILANVLGALAASAVGAGEASVGPEKARSLLQGCLSDPAWQDWLGEISKVLDHLSRCTER
jgi:ribokinase